MKHLIIFLSLTTFAACTTNTIGRKLYLEQWTGGARLHTDRHCANYDKNHVVEYIDTTNLFNRIGHYRIIPFCPQCVTDEVADQIEEILANQKETTLIEKQGDKIKALYEQLKNDGYTLDDEATFKEDILKDIAFQQQVYDAQKSDGYDMGDDFNAWQKRLLMCGYSN